MKLLFLDADGTLFHHEGYIPKSAIEACQQAQKNGHKICLATGRQNMEIYSDLLKIDYDGRITGAGAYVEAEGNLLYQENFSASQKQQLLDYFKEHQIPALFESSNALFVSQSTLEQLEAITKKACAGLDPVSYQKHGMVQILRNTKVVSNFSSCEFNKITFLSSATPYQQIAKDLGKDFDVIPATFEPLGKESGEVASLTIPKPVASIYYKITGTLTKLTVLRLVMDSTISVCLIMLAHPLRWVMQHSVYKKKLIG